jgi:serine/threonine protein kinase
MKHKLPIICSNNIFYSVYDDAAQIHKGNYASVYSGQIIIKQSLNKSNLSGSNLFKKFCNFLICNKFNNADHQNDQNDQNDIIQNDQNDQNDIIQNDIIVKITNDRGKKNLKNEIKCLIELQYEEHIIHPIKYKNNILCNDRCIVTECCKGGDLFDYYDKIDRLFNEKEIEIILSQIIDAIKECHKHNIAHCDIKLENIGLVEENDISHLKLLDFGGAQKISSNKNKVYEGNLEYSAHYAAPELLTKQCIKEGDLIYIDFWELGVLAYVLLTKKYPFDIPYADTREINEPELLQSLRQTIIYKTWEWPKDRVEAISPEMKSFVEHLLVKDPKDRCNLDIQNPFSK